MKKLNSVFPFWKKQIYAVFFIILLIPIFLIGFTGCKSLPAGNNVETVRLLDSDNDFFLVIPKNADSALVGSIISKFIPNLSDKNIKTIVDRTSVIYCGLKNIGGTTYVQAAIEGNIPHSLVSSFLTKKNGWSVRETISLGKSKSHKIYNSNGFDLSFPDKNIVCLGRNVESMLDRYNYLKYADLTGVNSNLPVAPTIGTSLMENTNLGDDYSCNLPFELLCPPDSYISFYSPNPKYFLNALTGANLDLQLTEVKGVFASVPQFPDEFVINMNLVFKAKKYLRAGKALMGFAFGKKEVVYNVVDDTKLYVSGIKIIKEKLLDLL